jgi:hypothetical protein
LLLTYFLSAPKQRLAEHMTRRRQDPDPVHTPPGGRFCQISAYFGQNIVLVLLWLKFSCINSSYEE